MLDDLRGMFAFAIWDRRAGELFLARDPYGIKPLYCADDGRTLRFASQVKALLAGGKVSRQGEPAGVVGFYLFGSVPEPYTLYQEIRSVPAGSWARVSAAGAGVPLRYFSLAETWRQAGPASAASPGALQETVRAALLDSVRHHLVSDVPVGAFLSAGIDSGSLVGLMKDAGQEDIHTVTLGFKEFEGTADDESQLAASAAARLGVRHTIRMVGEQEFRDDLPRILAAMDQPSIDGVNTWFVSKAAREAGLKVAVSGVGGDELFGGYSLFREIPRMVRRLWLPARVPGLGALVEQAQAAFPPLFERLHPKAASVVRYARSAESLWLLRRSLYLPSELPAILGGDLAREGLARLQPMRHIADVLEAGSASPGAPRPARLSPYAKVAVLEARMYLKNTLLRDTDWAGMAHSLEVRAPLVDSVLLTRLAPLLAARAGAAPGPAKHLLAASPSRPLDPSALRRAKTGFSTPIAEWQRRLPAFESVRRNERWATERGPWSRVVAASFLEQREWPTAGSAGESEAAPAATSASRHGSRVEAGQLHVVHFQRHAGPSQHSIERLFTDVRGAMPSRIRCSVAVSRFPSEGVLPRAWNALEAIARQGDVNHVTGDVHYLTYFLRRRRTLLTVLDCVSLHRLRGLRRALFRVLWYDLPLRRAALVTTISEAARRDLAASVGRAADGVRVVHCPVSPNFKPAPRRAAGGRPVILQVGTSPNKNVVRLAEAVAGLACELRVIGRLTDEQRSAITAAGVPFTAASNLDDRQMVRAYEEADIVTLASTYEGFGLPIVEANAVGRPVVTSNCSSMPEVAGDAACLVDPFDAASVRAGIRRVLEDDAYRAQLVEAGYANARRFEPRRIAAMYAELYDELAGTSRAS
jgi:asparagine synthase (glutamine-hydrolysing)